MYIHMYAYIYIYICTHTSSQPLQHVFVTPECLVLSVSERDGKAGDLCGHGAGLFAHSRTYALPSKIDFVMRACC